MSRFPKEILFIVSFLYFGVYQSYQVGVSPNVDFVQDNKNDQIPSKIQGVRVIVDAPQMNSGNSEDKTETVRIQTKGAKQTVGIHTDITFEIDDKKNNTKPMDGVNAESEENDEEVPVYRGTHTEGDRSNFNRRYDDSHRMNQANFHGTNDDDQIKYADAGTWIRFLPSANGAWTTERYSESFKPKNRGFTPMGFVPYGIGQKSFRPCVCDEQFWRDSRRRSSFTPSTPTMHGVDDKLEYPFSESD